MLCKGVYIHICVQKGWGDTAVFIFLYSRCPVSYLTHNRKKNTEKTRKRDMMMFSIAFAYRLSSMVQSPQTGVIRWDAASCMHIHMPESSQIYFSSET